MYKLIVKNVFRGVINQAENEEEKEVVAYGLEVIFSQIVSSLAILLIGLFSHNILETIVYIFCFCSIRVIAGGYHANTHLFCFLNTILIFLFFVLINSHITKEYNIVLIITAGISYLVALGLAPILNGKRTFSADEIQRGKKKVRLLLTIELLITIGLYQFNYEIYKFAVYAMITEGVYLIMGKIKYWNLNKIALLKKMMSISMAVAFVAATSYSLFFCHEPEMPKALKKKLEK